MLNDNDNPVGQLCERLAASLAEGNFVRLLLSGSTPKEGAAEKVVGRAVELKGGIHLSLTFHYPTRDEVHNLPAGKCPSWLTARLGKEFRNALLCTTTADWQLSIPEGKRARLIRHKPSTTIAPVRVHDQPRRAILDKTARDWLTGLGVTDRNGTVRPGMADKYTQINRYLEIFSHLAKDAGWIGTETATTSGTIVDMGAGKGYLTFGLWHLCRRIWGLPVNVIGIEARKELVANSNQLAQSVGAEGLQFVYGTVQYAKVESAQALIALHACDTATDDAIRRGIELNSQMILVAPCCQKELRPQLQHPTPLAPVLRHGVMEERMAEWVTDGLRALFLEWAGYETKVFEFVASEHTPKNLMIAAVRAGSPFTELAARERIVALKALFGIKKLSLDPLLDLHPSVS